MKPSVFKKNVYVSKVRNREMKRSTIAFWLSFLLFSVSFMSRKPAQADTTVIIIRTPNEIIIGADSLSTTRTSPRHKFLKCKIIQIGNVYFAAAGPTANTAGTYDAQTIATQACKGEETMLGKTNSFIRLVTDPLRKEIEDLRVKDYATYKEKTLTGDRVILQVVFAGLENDTLMYTNVDFIATHTDPNPVTFEPIIQSCPSKCDPKAALVVIGHNHRIQAFIRNNKGLSQMDRVQLVKKLIMLEFDDQEVAGPIDILRIAKDNARWIQHKPECVDIQQKASPKQPSKPAKSPPKRVNKPAKRSKK